MCVWGGRAGSADGVCGGGGGGLGRMVAKRVVLYSVVYCRTVLCIISTQYCMRRFHMYFSFIISIIEYLYRLQNCDNGLLREAYKLKKILHNFNVQNLYSSAEFLLKSLGINFKRCCQ